MVPDTGPLPEIELEGGAKITLLGPTTPELKRLRARWASAIRDFTPGDAEEAMRRLKERRDYRPPASPAVFSARQYGADRSPANGSSISFALEYEDVSLLLVGDAHARTLATTLSRLAAQRSVERLRFDAVKLPHHASMGNVNDDWLRLVDCEHWLVSTNGAVFGHPDVETAELIAKSRGDKPTTFYCNYESDTTMRLAASKDRWSTVFPKQKELIGPAGGLLFHYAKASRKNGGPGAPKKSAGKKKQLASKSRRAGRGR